MRFFGAVGAPLGGRTLRLGWGEGCGGDGGGERVLRAVHGLLGACEIFVKVSGSAACAGAGGRWLQVRSILRLAAATVV